jgi:hypothetical protein
MRAAADMARGPAMQRPPRRSGAALTGIGNRVTVAALAPIAR